MRGDCRAHQSGDVQRGCQMACEKQHHGERAGAIADVGGLFAGWWR